MVSASPSRAALPLSGEGRPWGWRLDEHDLFRSALDVAAAIVRADPGWSRGLVQSLADELGADPAEFVATARGQPDRTRSANGGGAGLSSDEAAAREHARVPIAAALAYRHAADELAHRIDHADGASGRATDRSATGLTPRERQVLALVAGGSTNRQVARHLELTERTVRKHLEDIYRRLDVSNRVAASRWWIETTSLRR